MKAGDTYPIQLDQWTVAEAVVVEVGEDQVTLDIPATRIVMGLRTSLADLTPEEPQKDHIILGDDRKTPTEPTINPATTATATNAPQSQVPAPNDAVGEGLAGYALKEME